MTVDIDALEALLAKMTPGPWRHLRDNNDSFNSILSLNDEHIAYEEYTGRMADFDAGDAAGIVALFNAAPELLSLVRGLEAGLASVREGCEELRDGIAKMRERDAR